MADPRDTYPLDRDECAELGRAHRTEKPMAEPVLTAVDVTNLMVENYWSLHFGIMTGCRCLSCHSFTFKDLDDKVVHEGESIEDLVRAARRGTMW